LVHFSGQRQVISRLYLYFTKFSVEIGSADQNSTKTKDGAEGRVLTKLELALMSSKGYDKER
jgi:hypothetical protein